MVDLQKLDFFLHIVCYLFADKKVWFFIEKRNTKMLKRMNQMQCLHISLAKARRIDRIQQKYV